MFNMHLQGRTAAELQSEVVNLLPLRYPWLLRMSVEPSQMTKPTGILPAKDRPQGVGDARAGAPASLRILATSDIHMHLLPFDYLSLCRSQQGSLARLGTLIRRRQAEVPTSVLLDNGDFLQGNPMGDLAAADAPGGPRKAHPAIAAMNALGYDAAALGNHDFNFGLSCLRRAAAGAAFPLLAANLSVRHVAPFTPYTILERELVLAAGGSRVLRIGIVRILAATNGRVGPGSHGTVAMRGHHRLRPPGAAADQGRGRRSDHRAGP